MKKRPRMAHLKNLLVTAVSFLLAISADLSTIKTLSRLQKSFDAGYLGTYVGNKITFIWL